jgi:IclR family transcriptional regulator, KDG regulon repressor
MVSRKIPSIQRAFEVLELFLQGTRALSVPEIVARLNFPRTTAYEIVNTLLASGYLTTAEGQRNRVSLGFKLFELGSAYAANFDLVSEGRSVAMSLVAQCDETVQMAVRDCTEAVFVAKVDCSKLVRLVSAVGSRLPAHCTGVGKVLLSALSDEEIVDLYQGQRQLTKMTANSITSVSKLLKELEVIRRRALAYDDCESNVDVRCVAAPVYDGRGQMVAAMSFSVPITRMSLSRQDELADIIRKGAKELSRRLGYGL